MKLEQGKARRPVAVTGRLVRESNGADRPTR
jgi:hypothetical protein